ncbi:MAG: efflux RND transporter periplasmic adaptor subunit [Synechococcales bacterium]|nr:efflux RND transporter periplasmic adaptor subunit [Synechococcales bacterium]
MQLPIVGKIRRPASWAIALLAAGLLGGGATTALIVWQNRPPEYDVADLTVPVESQSLAVRITASGTIEPVDTVNLSPRTSDIVTALYVEQGDRVTEGQIIARMKSDDLQAELAQYDARIAQAEARLAALRNGSRPEEIAQAEAQVAQAEARVDDAEARLALATDRLARNQELYEGAVISQNELDDFLNEADRARANLEETQFRLRESQDNLRLLQRGSRVEDIAEAEAQLADAIAQRQAIAVRYEDTIIRAPFDAIVTQKFATEGAFVTPTTSASEASSATSSAIVALAQGLEVVAEVPEVDINQIRPGQPVEVVADAFPNQVFEGQVKRIAPQAIEDPSRGDFVYFEVTVELLTGLDQLKSGLKADATFIGEEQPNALVVPAVAVVTLDGQEGVLVPDENDRIRFRPVTSGSQVGNEIQILEGVETGDRIFVELPPGQQLENLNFGRREEE